jgi:hypothetical protein
MANVTIGQVLAVESNAISLYDVAGSASSLSIGNRFLK